MATPEEIAEVRLNTDEPRDDEPFTDTFLGELIDGNGVTSASAIVWRKKAARAASLVNVSEAGSSLAMGDLQAKYLIMAKSYEDQLIVMDSNFSGRVRVKLIERDYGSP